MESAAHPGTTRLSGPASGRELKVYEPGRTPRDWNELLGPSQCAVLFRRLNSESPLASDATPLADFRDCTFLLFDRLDDARKFCESRVQQYPQLCCDIFDSRGRAKPPILTIVHPAAAKKDVISASSVRKRTIIAIVLWICALPLIWWDWHAGSGLVLPTVIGINMIFIGLRLFQWNAARGQRVRKRQPLGGFMGEGNSPTSSPGGSRRLSGSMTGMAASSAAV